MKKTFLFFLISFIFIIPCFSQNETITITTYYPAPYGVYNELRMYPQNTSTPCDLNHRGIMYYDLTLDTMRVCAFNGTAYVWLPTLSFWQLNGADIQNTNTGNVSVLTNLKLPATTATTGIIYLNTAPTLTPFIHNWGTDNTFIGENAGNLTMTAGFNTAIGTSALQSDVTGQGNTAVGWHALQANTAGNNTAVGYEALWVNNGGTNNTAIGNEALRDNTIGQLNTAVGIQALSKNINGQKNTAIGDSALTQNTTGNNNTAVGSGALQSTNIGSDNTAVGYQTGNTNQVGNRNVFLVFMAGNNLAAAKASDRLYIANSGSDPPLIYGNFSNGRVGLGTTDPRDRLQVTGGNIYVSTAGNGLIVRSPDGSICRRIGIDNAGSITTSVVACP